MIGLHKSWSWDVLIAISDVILNYINCKRFFIIFTFMCMYVTFTSTLLFLGIWLCWNNFKHIYIFSTCTLVHFYCRLHYGTKLCNQWRNNIYISMIKIANTNALSLHARWLTFCIFTLSYFPLYLSNLTSFGLKMSLVYGL